MMSLNIDMKIIRPWNFDGSPILVMNSWTLSMSCNVVNPWKIVHSNSIGKVLYCGESLNQLNCSSQTEFYYWFWFTFPRHNTEYENTSTFACERLKTSSPLTKDNCLHGESSSWFETLPKSHRIVRLSTFQICRTSVLKWASSLYFWWNVNCLSNSFPWTQMLQCWRHKHSPIIERLSMSCIASFEDWSCIFRNRSSTLFKNDRDFGERFDSVAVSESITSSSMTNLSVSWVDSCPPTSLSVLAPNISPNFPLLRRPLVVNVSSWVVWWASAHHKSPCSWLLLIPRGSEELLGFPMQSKPSTFGSLNAVSWDRIHHRRWFCCDSFFTCRVKFPFVNMSASWFLVSMYLIRILGSKLILSNNQSRATLRVLETCLIVGLLPLNDHLDHCFIVFEHIQQSFLTRGLDVWGNRINILHHIDLPLRFLISFNINRSPCSIWNLRHASKNTNN